MGVLDPIVHHLDVMPRPHRPAVEIALRRRQRLQHRMQAQEILLRPAHHQAVPLLQPPDPPGNPRVAVVNPLLPQPLRPPQIIPKERIPPIHHQVPGGQEIPENLHRLLGRPPLRQHQPHRPRRSEFRYKLLQRLNPKRAPPPSAPGCGQKVRLYPTTWCPPRTSRRAIFSPMRPRPTMAICIVPLPSLPGPL